MRVARRKQVHYEVHSTNYQVLHSIHLNASLFDGFSDSDWASSINYQNSTSGVFHTLGSTPIACYCIKKSTIALSFAEVEYHATVLASQELLWIRQLLTKFGIL